MTALKEKLVHMCRRKLLNKRKLIKRNRKFESQLEMIIKFYTKVLIIR